MKLILIFFLSFSISTSLHAASVKNSIIPASGIYDSGLILAYNKKTNLISGYYKSVGGWDEELKTPRFSCIFYIKGTPGRRQNHSNQYMVPRRV